MSSAGEKTLLIIDDEEINQAILSNIFQSEYQILTASDGFSGMAIIDAHQSSLSAILLDVAMPRMDGLSVLHCLHQRGLLRSIPIFLVTGDVDGDTMREAYDLGVMDVIFKPVVPYIVRRRVNSIVELFQARQKLGAEVLRQRDQLLQQAQTMADMNMGMVEALSTAIEFRSDESGAHVRRIHDITCYLLRRTPLGDDMSEDQIRLIGIGAITHDVGKISVPDAILNKPGRLTPEEFALMQSHTVRGAELLSKIPQMCNHSAYPYAYDIALHHHERWDGRGYPEGLVGDQISIWTQIVSLADVYDALVSKRCYKDALSPQAAMEMILRGECGAFNPYLLKCFQQAEPVLRTLYECNEGGVNHE